MRAAKERSTTESSRLASAHQVLRRAGAGEPAVERGASRPEAVAQLRLADLANRSAQARSTAGYQSLLNSGAGTAALQAKGELVNAPKPGARQAASATPTSPPVQRLVVNVGDASLGEELATNTGWIIASDIDVALNEGGDDQQIVELGGVGSAHLEDDEDIYLVGHGSPGLLGAELPDTVAEVLNAILPEGYTGSIKSLSCSAGVASPAGGGSGVAELAEALDKPDVAVHGPSGIALNHPIYEQGSRAVKSEEAYDRYVAPEIGKDIGSVNEDWAAWVAKNGVANLKKAALIATSFSMKFYEKLERRVQRHLLPKGEDTTQEVSQTKSAVAQRVPRALAAGAAPVQREAARPTGLPEPLRAGVESLSGMPMDDVKVHYDSPRPAQLQALAYTQASEIHVAPGQENHLPHEAWHAAQQAQGRVAATAQLEGVALNDDVGLEHEADVMGAKALALGLAAASRATDGTPSGGSAVAAQRKAHGQAAQLWGGSGGVVQRVLAPADRPRLKALIDRTAADSAGRANYSQDEADRALRFLAARYDSYDDASLFVVEALEEVRPGVQQDTATLTGIFGDRLTASTTKWGLLCLEVGCSNANMQRAMALTGSAVELGAVLYMMYVDQSKTGGIQLADQVASSGCISADGRTLVIAAGNVVAAGVASSANIVTILTRYLNAGRCQAMTALMGDLTTLGTANVGTVLADQGRWPPALRFLVFARVLRAAAGSANPGRAIGWLHHTAWVMDRFDNGMDVLAAAHALTNARLDWLLDHHLAAGNGAAARADAGTFIEAQAAGLAQQVAEVLVQSWNVVGGQRARALADALNGAGSFDAAHAKLFALKSTGGHLANAQAALGAAHYDVAFARNLLQHNAGGNCAEHYANGDVAAQHTAQARAAVAGNGCIPTGLNGMATQLQRVLEQHRAEINQLPADGHTRSSLLRYPTQGAGNLWISIGGHDPVQMPWADLEVVVLNDPHNGLFLVHCQPNTTAGWT